MARDRCVAAEAVRFVSEAPVRAGVTLDRREEVVRLRSRCLGRLLSVESRSGQIPIDQPACEPGSDDRRSDRRADPPLPS